MENKMTKKEFQSLLERVQEIQRKDCGAHDMSIAFYHDEDNRNEIWFSCTFHVRRKVHFFSCFRFLSYEQNLKDINKAFEVIKYKIEK